MARRRLLWMFAIIVSGCLLYIFTAQTFNRMSYGRASHSIVALLNLKTNRVNHGVLNNQPVLKPLNHVEADAVSHQEKDARLLHSSDKIPLPHEDVRQELGNGDLIGNVHINQQDSVQNINGQYSETADGPKNSHYNILPSAAQQANYPVHVVNENNANNPNYPHPQQDYPQPQQNDPNIQRDYLQPRQNNPQSQQDYAPQQQEHPQPQQEYPQAQQNNLQSQQNNPQLLQNNPQPLQNNPQPQQEYPQPQQNNPQSQQYNPQQQLEYPQPQQNNPPQQLEYPQPQQNNPQQQQEYLQSQQNNPQPQQLYPQPPHDYHQSHQNNPQPQQTFPQQAYNQHPGLINNANDQQLNFQPNFAQPVKNPNPWPINHPNSPNSVPQQEFVQQPNNPGPDNNAFRSSPQRDFQQQNVNQNLDPNLNNNPNMNYQPRQNLDNPPIVDKTNSEDYLQKVMDKHHVHPYLPLERMNSAPVNNPTLQIQPQPPPYNMQPSVDANPIPPQQGSSQQVNHFGQGIANQQVNSLDQNLSANRVVNNPSQQTAHEAQQKDTLRDTGQVLKSQQDVANVHQSQSNPGEALVIRANTSERIHVVTTFTLYLSKRGQINPDERKHIEQRLDEYAQGVINFLGNQHVREVHLLYEEPEMVDFVNRRVGNYRKLHLHQVPETKSDKALTIHQFAFDHLHNKLVFVTHADILMDKGFELVDESIIRNRKLMYALSRHEKNIACLGTDLCETYVGSHDAYIFVPQGTLTQRAITLLNHRLYDWGTENLVMYIYSELLGYKVLNPCKVVYIYHSHCSLFREDGEHRLQVADAYGVERNSTYNLV